MSSKRRRLYSDDEDSPEPKQQHTTFRPYHRGKSKDAFACQIPISAADAAGADASNLNPELTSMFEEMADILDALAGKDRKEEFRAKQYRTAAANVRRCPFAIESSEDADRVTFPKQAWGKKRKGEGWKRTRLKIKEFLETGTCIKLEELRAKPEYQAARLFTGIWGVGTNKALRLYHRDGCSTLDDVRERQDTLLLPVQRIGLAHYDDFQQKMDRREAETIGNAVIAAALTVNPAFKAMICGSFRRGKEKCGDVDVVISVKDDGVKESWRGSLDPIVSLLLHGAKSDEYERSKAAYDRRLCLGVGAGTHSPIRLDLDSQRDDHRGLSFTLFEDEEEEEPDLPPYNILTAVLRQDTPREDKYCETCFAVCRVPVEHGGTGVFRRVDIKVYSPDVFAFATLSFTGSAYFNRSMRVWARGQHMTLNDRGLYPVSHKGSERTWKGAVSVPATSEADVFAALGLDFIEPLLRNSESAAVISARCKIKK